MIKQVGQIMLYVQNQENEARFWTEKAGFFLKHDHQTKQGIRWIEISPSETAETVIVLHDKEFVASMSPELNLGTPSLMFFTENLEKLHADFSARNIVVGEIVTMPFGKVFNFADNENNYFAVMENAKPQKTADAS